MSHPETTADVQGVQHVSDAAYVTANVTANYSHSHERFESMFRAEGLILRTVAEWQAVEHAQAELAARTEMWEGIEFALREENRQLRIAVERLRKGRDAHSHCPAHPISPAVATAHALTLLPEPDARLGRGNAAMET